MGSAVSISYMRYSVGVKTPMYFVPVEPPAQNWERETSVCDPIPSMWTASRLSGPNLPACVGAVEGPKAPVTVMSWQGRTSFSSDMSDVPHLPAPESMMNLLVVVLIEFRGTVAK